MISQLPSACSNANKHHINQNALFFRLCAIQIRIFFEFWSFHSVICVCCAWLVRVVLWLWYYDTQFKTILQRVYYMFPSPAFFHIYTRCVGESNEIRRQLVSKGSSGYVIIGPLLNLPGLPVSGGKTSGYFRSDFSFFRHSMVSLRKFPLIGYAHPYCERNSCLNGVTWCIERVL